MSLIVSLDCAIIPGYGTISRSLEESSEIDGVVGPNRLPGFEDRPSLPYINAIVKESLQWNLVAPLGGYSNDDYYTTSSQGIPQMATNNDGYNGYYIPKGAVVIGNAWSVVNNYSCSPTWLFCVRLYCMTPMFSTIQWNSDLNGI